MRPPFCVGKIIGHSARASVTHPHQPDLREQKVNAREILKIKRINLAERMFRVTGKGIYRDSYSLELPAPVQKALMNGNVFGSDSVVNAIYQEKFFWFWGDTNRSSLERIPQEMDHDRRQASCERRAALNRFWRTKLVVPGLKLSSFDCYPEGIRLHHVKSRRRNCRRSGPNQRGCLTTANRPSRMSLLSHRFGWAIFPSFAGCQPGRTKSL